VAVHSILGLPPYVLVLVIGAAVAALGGLGAYAAASRRYTRPPPAPRPVEESPPQPAAPDE
jgi:hypothetical protein